jgi:RimJ/RimL family protein N-acetyltransferase
MIPLHHEAHFTFRFADDRIIPRFHLEGIEAGRRISIFRLNPTTGEHKDLIGSATVGPAGWVDLAEPIIVRGGDEFIAVPIERGGPANEAIRLRPLGPGDLPRMYAFQLDPDSNRMAVTNPRSAEAFDAHWAKVLVDPEITANAIMFDGEMVGSICCFPIDGQAHVGYWLDREHWGMGIATRALHLLLGEVKHRPLIATAATSNAASLRILQKCGFVVEEITLAPATERFLACEKATLVLW